MTKKSAEFIFQPGIIGRFLGAGPLNSACHAGYLYSSNTNNSDFLFDLESESHKYLIYHYKPFYSTIDYICLTKVTINSHAPDKPVALRFQIKFKFNSFGF